MTSAAIAPVVPPRTARIQWIVLALLVLSVCINYIDRGNLSVAGVAVAKQLHLDAAQLGYLFSAFFWTYAGCQILWGWLIDRFSVIWLFAIGFALWSAATALTGLAASFGVLFGLRLLLGLGESVAYPSYSKILAIGFPERQRGIANGLIDAGSKIGPAIGMFVGGGILTYWGWHAVFLSIGIVSLLWLLPWCFFAPQIEKASLVADPNGPRIVDILRQRVAWATFVGLFCANYGWYFMLTWLPGYLQMERHYSNKMMTLFGSLPFCAVALGACVAGWLSDAWIVAGGSVTRVRKTFVVSGMAVCAALMIPSFIAQNQVLAMALLILACFSYGFFSSNNWAITQTLAGATAAGKWTGLQNTAGNIAGIVAPVVTGYVVRETHSFFVAFIVVSVNLLVGAAAYLCFVPRVEPVRWDLTTTTSTQTVSAAR